MIRTKLVLSEALRSIRGNVSTSFAATMTVLIGMRSRCSSSTT